MKLLKNKSYTSGFIVGVAIILLLSFLSSASSAKKIAEHAYILQTFERAKIANHDMNESVLRLKTYLLHSYDPIVSNAANLRDLCQNFAVSEQYEILRGPSFAAPMKEYCDAVETKISYLERFKSEQSILRNSIKYLPLLTSGFKKSRHRGLAHSILANLLIYNIEPSLTLEKEIYRQLQTIRTLETGKNEKELFAALELHANKVVTQSARQQQLEQKILSRDLERSLEKLEQVYLDGYQSAQNRSLLNFYGLVLLCLTLAAWLASVFFRVEKEVQTRTKELSEAMKQLAESQQAIVQATKMTALGEMAGGIAHEINTPLSAILLNAGVVLDNEAVLANPALKKRVEAIIKVVDRVAKIVSGLRRFSRNSESASKTLVPVQSIIDDTLTLCGEKLKASAIDVRVVIATPGLTLECVPEHISQVLMNFLINSLDAMNENVPGNRWIVIAAAINNGATEISVTDAGAGIPLNVQQKLMQPFFTTKPVGVGTGLGLSISKGIVEQHGGRLFYDVDSPNTRFVMRFPREVSAAA